MSISELAEDAAWPRPPISASLPPDGVYGYSAFQTGCGQLLRWIPERVSPSMRWI